MFNEMITAVLREHLPFWGCLSESERLTVAAASRLLTFKQGTVLNNVTGAETPGIQILYSGKARVFMSSSEGKQLTIMRGMSGGTGALGMSCVLDRPIYDVGIETESECGVLIIPRDIVRQIYDSNQAVKDIVIREIADRFSDTLRRMESISFASARNRLANTLIELSALAGSDLFEATHAGLAADIGTVREVVSRLLKHFQLIGLITVLRGKIRIENMPELIKMRGEYMENANHMLFPRPQFRPKSSPISLAAFSGPEYQEYAEA